MFEILHWLGDASRRRPKEFLAVMSASMMAVVIIACVGCLVLATFGATVFLNQPKVADRAGAPTANTLRSTDAPGLQGTNFGNTPLPVVSAESPESQELVQTPMPTSGTSVTDAAEPVPSPEPTLTLEAPDLTTPVDAQILTTTIEPMSVPAPESALEFTPTIQLTLSSVIFIENVGQYATGPRFQMRGALGGGVWLEPDAIWITLIEPAPVPSELQGDPLQDAPLALRRGVALRLGFEGANPNPQLVPFDPLDTQVSYFDGVPANWHIQVPVWGGVRYQNLYPGVDLELTSEGGRYVQRLVVQPGADLSAVRLRVSGAEAVALEPLLLGDGEDEPPGGRLESQGTEPVEAPRGGAYLRLTTALGEFSLPLLQVVTADGFPFSEPLPPAPRLAPGGDLVEFPFLLLGAEGSEARRQRSGSITAPSPGRAADLLYATFVGKGGSDEGYAVAVDRAGRAFVTGRTYVPGFPLVAGEFDAELDGDDDVFVVKLKTRGSEVAYLAVVGGSGDEGGYAVALDQVGNAYVAGGTDSVDLPVTSGAFDPQYGGSYDAFVIKLGAAGTELGYSTFLGGGEDDWGQDIAVDRVGNAYVTGYTQSTDFPATKGAWDTVGEGQDAFVVEVNALGSGLVYSTFLGGRDADQGNAIAVDGAGRAYVAGSTRSADFPTTAGAFATDPRGEEDAFLARMLEGGTELAYATLLGGRGLDQARGVAVDDAGGAYVVGLTQSPDFPTTAWGFDLVHDGVQDAFVAKVDGDGAELEYASFLGGDGLDWAQAVAVDGAGYAYVTGATQALVESDGASMVDSDQRGAYDALVVRIGELGTEVAYVTTMGGSGRDCGWDLDVDGIGSVYMVGMSESPDFLLETLASEADDLGYVPQRPANTRDSFVTKLVVGTPFLDLPVSYTNFAQAALGNMNDSGPGRVNSWFDHSYPSHSRNQKMVRWDGGGADFTALSPPRIGESWYDGHGGTDFRWETRNEPIYAAAPGTVIDTYAACKEGDQTCGSYFGNRVWIDHGNGYATVYAHLGAVYVSDGMAVVDPAAQPLGTMGNTGRSQGLHLHFGLYFDQNGDGQWTQREVVDPYGWTGPSSDPWSGLSRYLWKHPLLVRQLSDDTEITLAAPSGLVTATIPAMAFGSIALGELWEMPSEAVLEDPRAAASLVQWRSAGRSFRLTARGVGVGELDSTALEQPIALQMAFRLEDVQRLDLEQLTIRRWDEDSKTWSALPTTVDATHRLAIAQTTELGKFELQAPLSCATDIYEPDDHYAAALAIPASGFTVRREFDIAEDRDWFRVEVKGGAIYVAETRYLAEGVDTLLSLHNLSTLATLASSDSRRDGGSSYLRWRAPENGSVLLQVSRAGGSLYGCSATYALHVRQVVPLEKVTITGPKVGVVDTSYAFTATINPITATQPVTYTWWIVGKESARASVGTGDMLTSTWPTTGTYQVVLTATNEGGGVRGAHSIAVYSPLSAAFTASPVSGSAPLEVTFINNSSLGYSDSWWEFGDGKASGTENPSHTYKEPGVYTVTLTVSGLGDSDTKTRYAYITVQRSAPLVWGEFTVHLPIVLHNR
jgi:murein DD-endopeptidase MepM/ murein hydrolase activator NlpD